MVDDKHKGMQTFSDSEEECVASTYSPRPGQESERLERQFGSAAVTRNTHLYGDARIKVEDNLRVKTAEYQHRPESRVRQIHAQYNEYNARAKGGKRIRRRDLHKESRSNAGVAMLVQTEEMTGNNTKQSQVLSHGQQT